MELSNQLTGVSKARTLSRPEQTMINDSVSISTVLKALGNLLRRSVSTCCLLPGSRLACLSPVDVAAHRQGRKNALISLQPRGMTLHWPTSLFNYFY